MTDTKPKPFIFILMPFSEDFDDIYQLGIKPACTEAGGYCERVDEQIFHESILERIYNQINKADLVVADMTGRNANVFYETGYAHALGKKVILLTQCSDDIPFDLKHYPHIVYSGHIAELKEELQRRVSWYLTQSDKVRVQEDAFDRIAFYINGQRLERDVELSLPNRNIQEASEQLLFILRFTLSLHNPTQQSIHPKFQVAFLFPSHMVIRQPNLFNNTRLPDGRVLTETVWVRSEIGPFCWSSKSFKVAFHRYELGDPAQLPVTMRLFSERGIKDIPFSLTLGS